jgi:hypothetical protein
MRYLLDTNILSNFTKSLFEWACLPDPYLIPQ